MEGQSERILDYNCRILASSKSLGSQKAEAGGSLELEAIRVIYSNLVLKNQKRKKLEIS